MIDFIIKSTISLGILYLFYILVLNGIKTFKFNRYFLLASIVFSLAIPFISYPIDNNVVPIIETTGVTSITSTIEQTGELIEATSGEGLISLNTFLYVYVSISLILLLRFGLNLSNIIKTIISNKKERIQNHSLLLVKEQVLPHTFFNYIMVNKDDHINDRIDEALLQHEITHCKQWHSVDIVFIELIKIILWINPFIWLVKKSIQLNHEYLADNSVLASHNLGKYQNTFINIVLGNNLGILISNFNFSLTKQRLEMMTKQYSKNHAICSYIISVIVFVLIGSSLAFTQKKDIEYNLNIGGIVENYTKNGLKHSDFAMMKITTNNKRLKVEKFEIILARGPRIITLHVVNGKSFDLNTFSKRAREGDRIIMEIKELSDKNIELTQYNSIITMRIDFDK